MEITFARTSYNRQAKSGNVEISHQSVDIWEDIASPLVARLGVLSVPATVPCGLLSIILLDEHLLIMRVLNGIGPFRM